MATYWYPHVPGFGHFLIGPLHAIINQATQLLSLTLSSLFAIAKALNWTLVEWQWLANVFFDVKCPTIANELKARGPAYNNCEARLKGKVAKRVIANTCFVFNRVLHKFGNQLSDELLFIIYNIREIWTRIKHIAEIIIHSESNADEQ